MRSSHVILLCAFIISINTHGMHIPIRNSSTLITFNEQTKTILSWISHCLSSAAISASEPFAATRLIIKMDNDLLDIGDIGELKQNHKALEHIYNGNALYCAQYLQEPSKSSDGEYNYIPAIIIGTNNPDNCILLWHSARIKPAYKAKL